MKRNKKRQAELKAKTQSSSLEFQTMWGAHQKMTEVNAEVEGRIREELQVLNNMGVAGDMLTLKTLLDDIQLTMGASAEHSRGILAGSVVAYCLGLDPPTPYETGAELDPQEFRPPLQLTVSYDNEIRNQVVDHLKSKGCNVTTYLGQPLLKLPNINVVIRRVVKA